MVRAIGQCLGAIASTRYGGRDPELFETEVARPSSALKSLLEDLRSDKARISKSCLQQAIEITGSVLTAKQVSEREIVARFSRLLGPHVVDLRQAEV